ncbi:hypothetical protein CDEN61S_03997 [Castellaniella denitrificans]
MNVALRSRALKGRGLEEGISTRMLIYAGLLMRHGVGPARACRVAMTDSLTDDEDMVEALNGCVDAYFG